MSQHVVFVTSEFDPVVPGGAGAVVAGIVTALRAAGSRTTVLLVTADDVAIDDPDVILIHPDTGVAESEGPQLAASRAVAAALRDLLEDDPASVVEFQDCDGLAFWPLTHRSGTPLERTRLVVRYHLPADHILDAIGVERPELAMVRVMERGALRAADAVIVQTSSMAEVVEARYAPGSERIVLGPPPVPRMRRVVGPRNSMPRFVIVGRLSEQKGCHDAVRAFGPLLAEHPDLVLEFVGSDGWSASADLPMSEWLPSLVPEAVRDRLRITGPVPRRELPDHLEGAWAVVVPSRLESFCLAAHEARAMGLPVIARDQPAIADHFDEAHGALLYSGGTNELRRVVASVLDQPDVLDTLARAPLPAVGDPIDVYRGELPEPRHPQSQAGLATAAIHELEELGRTPDQGRGRGASVARRILRVLPEPLARGAARYLPAAIKDRFRPVASWPAEQERRSRVGRHAAVRKRIAAGDFETLEAPRVSIVIPCFDHGAFLEDALLTVFEQTFVSWEVIVVDDGSTDAATVHILKNLDRPRVRVIHQENTGLPGARNTGIRHSRGEFVVPLDADDELLPGYLTAMVEALDRDPDAAFAHCWAELFGDVNWVWATRPYNPYTELLSNSVLQIAMFRRSAWDEVGGYDPTMTSGNEDWDLWLRFQEAGWGNTQVREPLYRYRKHGTSMSVDTEADFERGRRRIMERHPRLYEPKAARDLKLHHYPLVSLIVPSGEATGLEGVDVDDAEVVVADPEAKPAQYARARGWAVRTAGSSRCVQVGASAGKYVVFAEGSLGPALSPLLRRLEREPSLGAARDEGSGLAVYRRWSLVDPGCDLDLSQVPPLVRCPEDAWSVPPVMEVSGRELPVVRQRPEEEGYLPEWVR